jgi:hypothetical protein
MAAISQLSPNVDEKTRLTAKKIQFASYSTSLSMDSTKCGLHENVAIMKELSADSIDSSAHTDEMPLPLIERQSSTDDDYILYPNRWLVLTSFCLLSGCNAWMWVTWSPLTALVAVYWHVPESSVDALSGVFMYVFVPTNIVSMWLVVNHLGLAKGLTVGATLNMMGALLRFAGPFIAGSTKGPLSEYQLVYMGTFLCALGQTFILPMIALLSGSWFGENERATATSMGVLASQTGTLLGLGSTAFVDFQLASDTDMIVSGLDPTKLCRYLQLQCIVAVVALVMVVINITADRPPTPPSEAAALLTRRGNKGLVGVPYIESMRITLCSSSSRRFFGVFGLAVGVFYALPTFLSQFMPGWSPQAQGLLGVIFQVAAVVGCSAAGTLVGYFQLQYKKISLWLLGGCLACTVLYLVSVHNQTSIAMVACGGLGFFFSSFMSVGIEYGTALTYPADEAAVYGMLDSTGELIGFVLVTVGGAMSSHTHYFDVWFCGILVGCVGVALVILWRMEATSRRPSNIAPPLGSNV